MEPHQLPVVDYGEPVSVVHTVKEVSQSSQLLDEVARDVDHGVAWDPADPLHALEAVSTVESAQYRRRQQALATENRQRMRAIATRDMIGQAKDMLMERFNVDPDRAFGLLTRLSQEANTRVEEIARNLVQTERPPRSG